MKKVGIVVLNWNGGEFTFPCVESVKQSDYRNWQLVIVDNGSIDGSPERITRLFPDVHLIRNPGNMGFAKATNQGIAWVLEHGADFALILNNDTRIDPRMISHLVRTASAYDDLAAISPKMYQTTNPDRLWFAYGRANLWTGIFSNPAYNSVDGSQFEVPREAEFLSGCCILIPKKIIQAVGAFDVRFFAYCEDVDWSLRCRRAGFQLRYCPMAKLWHGKLVGDGRLSPLRRYLLTRNHLWVMRKNAHFLQLACASLLFPLRSLWRLIKVSKERQWQCIPAELRGARDGFLLPVRREGIEGNRLLSTGEDSKWERQGS